MAAGKYSFHGGIALSLEGEDDILGGEDDDDDLLIDPSLRYSASTSATNTRPGTPLLATSRSSTADSQAIESSEASETQSQKRHRESAHLQPPPGTGKKAKVSGAAAIDKISNGLLAMAEAVTISSSEQVTKETVDSTLQGQAQEKVQDEGCLTEEGQLVMLERLSDPTLARTFMAIKSEGLRIKWLKKQLEKHLELLGGGNLEELYID